MLSSIRLALIAGLALVAGPSTGARASDEPWPRLPDGRVVITIKGERLAFDPNLKDDAVEFTAFTHGARRFWLRTLIERPGEARAFFAAQPSVWVLAINPGVYGRFLNRFDRPPMPVTYLFAIGIHEDRAARACRHRQYNEPYNRWCERLERLAHDPPALDEHGFIVDDPAFLRGLNSTFYIWPAAERLSATGEPIYLRCDGVLKNCVNDLAGISGGYFVRPGVQLFYKFGLNHQPEPTWRDVDARYREFVDDLIVTDRTGAQP